MKDVENYIRDILKTRKLHFTLIDPDEQTPEEALDIATQAIEGGSDGIMIGGSTVNGDDVDNTCKILSENIAVPIIIFPGNTSSVSSYADAIFYMSFVNSRNSYWINGAQALAAPAVKASGMEILPMHYMVVSPGGTVGWVGDANLVPRNSSILKPAQVLLNLFLPKWLHTPKRQLLKTFWLSEEESVTARQPIWQQRLAETSSLPEPLWKKLTMSNPKFKKLPELS